MSTAPSSSDTPTLFGHPTALFTLFFAEMWERFSYYGMRALLLLYMAKGFLGYHDEEAYSVYGAYTALVYATPFIGGMLADRLLGARKAVIFGGLLMAGGHLLMTYESDLTFFTALALLICGNGFFKPNISTIVGTQYPKGSVKKDAGFTIFYMGINLGAAMAPLLCGYVGETLGWHYGFGLATFGMLVGLAVFVAPVRVTQVLILVSALGSGGAMIFLQSNPLLLVVNGVVALALVIAGVIAVVALNRGGLPADVGVAPDEERLEQLAFPTLRENAQTYYLALIGGFLALQFVTVPYSTEAWMIAWAAAALLSLPWLRARDSVYVCVAAAVPIIALLVKGHVYASYLMYLLGFVAFGSLIREAFRSERVERQRMFVVLILMVFSCLFWAFFEQAGSSVTLFTDRNVDRVMQETRVDADDVGTSMTIVPTQEQVGYDFRGHVYTLDQLDAHRETASEEAGGFLKGLKRMLKQSLILGVFFDQSVQSEANTLSWPVNDSHVGMGVANEGNEIKTSVFQSANPIYILVFGLGFSVLWTLMARMKVEPSTPVKFSLGLLQLGLGFAALWWGAYTADARGMVGMHWVLLGYLLHTTGELCLSPVGLSMVTKLSPKRIVSTVMGAWFLATAFSNLFAAQLAKLTGVGGEGGEEQLIPPPIETVNTYGDLFFTIGVTAVISSVVLFALSPLLTKWMHSDEFDDDDEKSPDTGGDGAVVTEG